MIHTVAEVSATSWLLGILGMITAGIALSAICWLVKEVLELRKGLITLQVDTEQKIQSIEQKIKSIDKNCDRHQRWGGEMQRAISRIDRNLVRLCLQNKIEYESPPD